MTSLEYDDTAPAAGEGAAPEVASPPAGPPRPPRPPRPARRPGVALLALLHAAVLGWGAAVLPWRAYTAFAVVTAALAVAHAATAALWLAPHPLAPRAWRATSFAALAYLAWLTFSLLSAAVYVASLNRGLGTGIAAAMMAVWAIVVLLTLPFACWGLSATGGLRGMAGSRRARGALAAAIVIGAGALAWQHRAAKADALPVPGGTPEAAAAALRDAIVLDPGAGHAPEKASSLFTTAPASCAAPPAPGRATIVVTYLARDESARAAPATRCVQPGPGEDAAAALRAAIAPALRGPIKIDVISAVQPLGAPGPGLDGLALRPGLDGACLEGSCLMPWQLVAIDAFNANMPFPDIPDFRFGFTVPGLRKALGDATDAGSRRGLRRVETLSWVADADGALHLLSHVGVPGRALDAATLEETARAAQGYIVAAQRSDGMFRYVVDPFTGRASFDGFSIARQAGTTLALCELGSPAGDVKPAVERSLAMLAKLERRGGPDGALGALVYPQGSRDPKANLNPTALGLVAFLSCRPLVGPRNDALIARLARTVLATQRDDGGFAPQLELASGKAVPGPTQLYEGGQSVLALTLLEGLLHAGPSDPPPDLPAPDALRAVIDRAMEYYATAYWDHFGKDFVWMEENWHCLAARAALPHHRNDAYERFCLDYVTFKSRLVLEEGDGVHFDFVGGYGFGNVLPPHNTSTAGYGEALAAAMAVKQARGEDLTADRARMEKVLAFLVRQQWRGPNCFACARNVAIQGGFSESMASPRIRIDYVQHAWAALGHGGRMLGLAQAP